jgi:putative transposase
MTMELKEAGLDVGERRVGRLMKIHGIRPIHPSPQGYHR